MVYYRKHYGHPCPHHKTINVPNAGQDRDDRPGSSSSGSSNSGRVMLDSWFLVYVFFFEGIVVVVFFCINDRVYCCFVLNPT